MALKKEIFEIVKDNYAGRFEFRLHDKNPKLLFEYTLGIDFIDKIRKVIPVYKISATEKNSTFNRIGFGLILYIRYKEDT